jgi:hypothetical protein
MLKNGQNAIVSDEVIRRGFWHRLFHPYQIAWFRRQVIAESMQSKNVVIVDKRSIVLVEEVPQAEWDAAKKKQAEQEKVNQEMQAKDKAAQERRRAIEESQMELAEEELRRRGKKIIPVHGTIPGKDLVR